MNGFFPDCNEPLMTYVLNYMGIISKAVLVDWWTVRATEPEI
jgi:hypothetical protein